MRPRRFSSGATVASSGWYCESATLKQNVARPATTNASRTGPTSPSSAVSPTQAVVKTMRIGL